MTVSPGILPNRSGGHDAAAESKVGDVVKVGAVTGEGAGTEGVPSSHVPHVARQLERMGSFHSQIDL